MKLLEDLLAGEWVYGFDEDVRQMLLDTEELCFRLNNLSPRQEAERAQICRRLFGEISEPFTIHSPFRCDFGSHIRVGRNLVANYNLTVLDEGLVTIGDNVFIGPNCSIYTINHALIADERNRGVMRARAVTIGNNVWLGGNVVVLPGVTIGDGAVIGAGSVVSHDVAPGMLAAGVPARELRPVSEADRTGL